MHKTIFFCGLLLAYPGISESGQLKTYPTFPCVGKLGGYVSFFWKRTWDTQCEVKMFDMCFQRETLVNSYQSDEVLYSPANSYEKNCIKMPFM